MLARRPSFTRRLPYRWGYPVFAVLAALLFAACGLQGPGVTATPTNTPSPDPRQKPSPVVSSPTASPTSDPRILPGDWQSFLLGRGGFNTQEEVLTPTTAPALIRSWEVHAEGGRDLQ